MQEDDLNILKVAVQQAVVPSAVVHGIVPKAGQQGYSGAALRYYDVSVRTPSGEVEQCGYIVKEANLLERQTMNLLQTQGQGTPFCYVSDVTDPGTKSICMREIAVQPPPLDFHAHTGPILARIHASNMGGDLPFLPRLDRSGLEAFLTDWWRVPWENVWNNRPFTDASGNEWPVSADGAVFANTFERYVAPLQAAEKRLLDAVEHWWKMGDALTLLHGDLHGEHVLWDGRQAHMIDWGQAKFGPLYLDLPNLFERNALSDYYQTLSQQGFSVPYADFMDFYHEASRYFAFKYFGIGLWNWQNGDQDREGGVMYWIRAALDGK